MSLSFKTIFPMGFIKENFPELAMVILEDVLAIWI